MGGRRTTKDELAQIEALTREGLTAMEIAQRLGRSPSAIKNLRYKKHLITRTKDEIEILFQQRDDRSIEEDWRNEQYYMNCIIT